MSNYLFNRLLAKHSNHGHFEVDTVIDKRIHTKRFRYFIEAFEYAQTALNRTTTRIRFIDAMGVGTPYDVQLDKYPQGACL